MLDCGGIQGGQQQQQLSVPTIKNEEKAGAPLFAPRYSSYEVAVVQKRAESADCLESFPI